MLVGNYLNQEEINDLIKSFEGKTKFQNLICEMQHKENFVFDPEQVEVIQAIKFDVAKNEDIISAKVLYLKVSENVNVRYTVRHLNGDEATTNDFFTGELSRAEEDEIKVTNYRARHDNYVSSFDSTLTEEAIALGLEVDKKSEEEFPIDEKYVPGMLLNQDVESLGTWYQGCLPGGYVWCGDDCGGAASCTSSTKGVNGLDNCCKTHDCCYHRYGVSYPHCYCDQNLCDCSQAAPYAWNKGIVEPIMCFVC